MGYSFTEKKRLRKSFSKRPEGVLPIPYLLSTQLSRIVSFYKQTQTLMVVILKAWKQRLSLYFRLKALMAVPR